MLGGVTAVLVSVGAIMAQPSPLASYTSYKRDLQREFAEEVAGKKGISLVSQTARMLAMLEFMDPQAFPKLEECLKKFPSWSGLPATKREQVVDACQSSAKLEIPKMVGPSPAAVPEKPGLPAVQGPQLQEVQTRLNEVISQLREIDSKVASLQDGQKNLQEALVTRERTRRVPAAELPTEEELQ